MIDQTVLTSSELTPETMAALVRQFRGEKQSHDFGFGNWIVPWQYETRFGFWQIKRHGGFLFVSLYTDAADAIMVLSPDEIEELRRDLRLPGLHVVAISYGSGGGEKAQEFVSAIINRYGGKEVTGYL